LAVRLARDLGLDSNPLRRASDRAEAWIRAGLLVVYLIGAPTAAVAAGLWTAHAEGSGTSARGASVEPAVLTGIMALAGGACAADRAAADPAAPGLAAPGRLGGGLAGDRATVDGAQVVTWPPRNPSTSSASS
jgi:hypothetical protein